MFFLITLLILFFPIKGYFHFKLLSMKPDEEISGRNSFLDSIVPYSHRILYLKIYMILLMLPIFRHVEGGDKLTRMVNYLVGLFYTILMILLFVVFKSRPDF